jgi:hypothetical protein
MEGRRSAVIVGMLLAAGPALAQSPAPTPSPASVGPAPARRLNLGAYGSALADDPRDLADQLRFREQVEVRGKAMDARSLTAKLAWWMKDIELDRGATPAALSAPSIEEMRDFRPHGGDAVNLVPVMQWVAEKLGGRKK